MEISKNPILKVRQSRVWSNTGWAVSDRSKVGIQTFRDDVKFT